VSAKPLFSAPFIAPFIAPVAPVHKQHLILLPPAPKNPSGRADAARKPDAAPVGHKELISLPPMPVIKGYAVPKSQIKRSTLKEPRTYSKMMMNSAEVIAQLPQARKINEQELIGIKLGSELTFIRKIFGRHVYNLTPKLVRELRLKPGDEFWGLYGKDWIEAIGSFVEWDGKKDHRLDAITVNLYQGFADLSQQVRLGDLAYAYKEKFTSDQDLMVVNGEELEDCYDYGDGSDSEGTRNKRGQKRLEFGVIQEDSQGGTCDQVLIFVKDKNVFKKLAATQKN
jgi:hypothetical protein